ncbi:MAG: 1-deoxy-D-xylulose-5-phosphate synthase [Synergistaceae bacterium]|nr:1-deoxy-D-xylulose-5-phosphate synthase [Synergistaceae bacterium]
MNFLRGDFSYKDLKNILPDELPELASEVRELIIKVTTENGGHLGSSLGAVDLIIAMLRRFDPVNDKIIFDVGHQSYAYKILTDRFDRFNTLRQKGGLAGFPRMSESPCDHFNTGHSSTSISAALGYAKARDLLNVSSKHNVIAFIGDASLINGLALEALNYVQEINTKLIIVLNDNKHSISNRVGGFSTMLARLSANKNYNKLKAAIKEYASEGVAKKLEAVRDQIKNFVKPENMFDDLDINYWGPFDGHDIASCETIFELAKNYDAKPVLLHFLTQKGKGLKEAEQDPTKYHQVAPLSSRKSATQSWSNAASAIVEELAAKDERIVCLTAAMSTGVKLENFRKNFKSRFFDVGIAESHMLTMAAGMAAGGLKPWVFIYSTFLQRAMDQLMHDIALQNLPVVLMIDRAGLVGEDGDTHQGLLDVSWARAVPNLKIYAPCDYNSLKAVINHAANCTSPIMIRYPRGNLPERVIYNDNNFTSHADFNFTSHADSLNFNAINEIANGNQWALLGHGVTTHLLLDVRAEAERQGLPVPAVYDLLRLKPLDDDILNNIFNKFKLIVTAEENYLAGGIGEAVAAKILDSNNNIKLKRFGISDMCVAHASIAEQREEFGLTVNNIIDSCKNYI